MSPRGRFLRRRSLLRTGALNRAYFCAFAHVTHYRGASRDLLTYENRK